MFKPKFIRNVAIVAHIDHGKTTLLDAMLKQTEVFRSNEQVPERIMDSYVLEKERGITIFAKHTSIFFGDYKINLIDTPGHADFSGEVERVLGMVNSVLLLVDAVEGPMPQTRFVLSQALRANLKPIVVLNKVDRSYADCERALNLIFDLFVELGAEDEQLDFAYCYASALSGFAKHKLSDPSVDMRPLFELIIDNVEPPSGDMNGPFLTQVMTLSYSDYLGRQATGRILSGQVRKGDSVSRVSGTGHPSNYKITLIEGYLGIKRVEMEEAGVGDIVSLSGIENIEIGDTICSPSNIKSLPPIQLSEPTISVIISINSSPFVGKDGKHVTMNKIKARLLKEKKSNVSLRIEEIEGRDDAMRMSGRGELHLAVVIEAMRREGYEFSVSKPKVIQKVVHGKVCEPFEMVHIEVPKEFHGPVMEEIHRRRGELKKLNTNQHNITTMEFIMPTRGLIGYRNDFLTQTRGQGILTSIFDKFAEKKCDIPARSYGSIISSTTGKCTGYALYNLQDRGIFFVSRSDEVYPGMIVGQHNKDNDLTVNITKEKQLTNVRSAGKDDNIVIPPPKIFSIEQALNFIKDDELVEVTPKFVRVRKAQLHGKPKTV